MPEIKVTTRAVTDREVEAVFDAVFPDEWPVDAVRIAATVRAWRSQLEDCEARLQAADRVALIAHRYLPNRGASLLGDALAAYDALTASSEADDG